MGTDRGPRTETPTWTEFRHVASAGTVRSSVGDVRGSPCAQDSRPPACTRFQNKPRIRSSSDVRHDKYTEEGVYTQEGSTACKGADVRSDCGSGFHGKFLRGVGSLARRLLLSFYADGMRRKLTSARCSSFVSTPFDDNNQ